MALMQGQDRTLFVLLYTPGPTLRPKEDVEPSCKLQKVFNVVCVRIRRISRYGMAVKTCMSKANAGVFRLWRKIMSSMTCPHASPLEPFMEVQRSRQSNALSSIAQTVGASIRDLGGLKRGPGHTLDCTERQDTMLKSNDKEAIERLEPHCSPRCSGRPIPRQTAALSALYGSYKPICCFAVPKKAHSRSPSTSHPEGR